MELKTKNGSNIEIVTSWDDFRQEDERLLELLIKYDLPAIIYIPHNEIIDPVKLALAKWAKQYFEIGSHTVNHPILTAISKDEMYAEVADSKSMLEEALGVEVTSFCYPKGRYNEDVIKILKKAGYTNARTVDVGNTDFPIDPFITKTTAHVYPRKEYKDETWLNYALNKFDEVMGSGGYFHLWGHAWEINKNNEWGNLEYFLSYLRMKIDEQQGNNN